MKRTLPFMFYLFYFGAAAFWQPFIVVYFQEFGLSGPQISLLAGITPLVILIAAPFWTGLADAKMRHRLILSLNILVTTTLAVIFPMVKVFTLMIPLVIIFALFGAPIISFSDSATMSMLADKKDLYGRVRLGGSIGWGILAPVAGMVIDKYDIRWVFWGYSLLMFITLFICQKFTFGQPVEQSSVRGDARKVLADRRWGIFMALAFVGGVAFMVVNTYFAPYMNELGITKTTVGFALTIATLSELPVFFFANTLLKRFTARSLFMLGLLITGLRIILYGVLNFQAGILIFQLLNGLTFPLVWVAGVSYANELAPQGMKATGQGLLGAMVFGIGAAIGGMVGGLLLGSIHGQATFLIIGIFVLVGEGVIVLLDKVQRLRQVGRAV